MWAARRIVLTTIAFAVGLGGCGRSGAPLTPPSSAVQSADGTLVRAGTPGSVTLQQGSSVPLGLTSQEVERRLGRPAVLLHRRDIQSACMLYEIVGQPAKVRLQYCFIGGKLRVLSTYLHD